MNKQKIFNLCSKRSHQIKSPYFYAQPFSAYNVFCQTTEINTSFNKSLDKNPALNSADDEGIGHCRFVRQRQLPESPKSKVCTP